jgi:hypothetical protein
MKLSSIEDVSTDFLSVLDTMKRNAVPEEFVACGDFGVILRLHTQMWGYLVLLPEIELDNCSAEVRRMAEQNISDLRGMLLSHKIDYARLRAMVNDLREIYEATYYRLGLGNQILAECFQKAAK